MLEELKLHIGVHKTGTSATQMMVSKLLSSGENDNIIYPKTGLLENWPFAHHTLCNELHLGDDKILFDLKEEVLNSGNKTCLISCEDFSNYSSINLIFQISNHYFSLHLVHSS